MDSERFLTQTLRSIPVGMEITEILAAAIDAVDPGEAVRRNLEITEDRLNIAGETIPLSKFSGVVVVGAGKASLPMARAVHEKLGDRIREGMVITKKGQADGISEIGMIRVREGGHPVPDEDSVAGARDLLSVLENAGEYDLVLCLISGGGSALMSLPAKGVSLAELQTLTGLLLGCGAEIGEINTLRKHLDSVKGGGLAAACKAKRMETLILSDVVGDPLEIIASGPTVGDPSTYANTLAILEKYGLRDETPRAILNVLVGGAAGKRPETPKPGSVVFNKVRNTLIGNNELTARAALEKAKEFGYRTRLLSTSLTGEAREAGIKLAEILKEIDEEGAPLPRPVCIAVGGETTVTLRGKGIGGRNQELALSAVKPLSGIENVVLVALATDGGDGPTDAAGAVVSGESLGRAKALGLNPAEYLRDNNAYPFFEALGDLLMTGPTQTNVNDLNLLFAYTHKKGTNE